MNERVTITTGARLHFGPLAVRAASGPDFGGLGLMVEHPRCVVTVTQSDQDWIEAGERTERIRAWVECCRRHSPVPPCAIRLQECIPEHAGFGSGTQLALAVGRGLSAVGGEHAIDTVALARRVERGRRSAVGIHGFAAGGLIVDAGRRQPGTIGELACRLEVPSAWRFVLVTPPRQGLSGQPESVAFERLQPMPAPLTGQLSRLVLCDILPAVRRTDFATFAAALEEYGTRVGQYFAPVQGAVFSDARMLALADSLRFSRRLASVQTSWGPSIAIPCPDETTATAVARDISADQRWTDCTVICTAARNSGAAVHAAREADSDIAPHQDRSR